MIVIHKGYAPAIADIWGREGGGRRRLIQIKKCVLLFAIDGVRMFEACMCTFRMADQYEKENTSVVGL